MNELKPCPFCGGKAKTHTGITLNVPKRSLAYCYCTQCQARSTHYEDKKQDGTFLKEAIAAWNRRATDER